MPDTLHPSLSPDSTLLDVRPMLSGGKDPFAAIMQAIGGLAPGKGLVVRAPFEPKPLFGILASKGYKGRSLRLEENDWLAEFLPGQQSAAAPQLRLDVRGLQPPEPMMQILAACENLAPGATLEVTHDRRPEMLYARLDERGLAHATSEGVGGVIHIKITRAPGHGQP